jgi:hypothetical protein
VYNNNNDILTSLFEEEDEDEICYPSLDIFIISIGQKKYNSPVRLVK